MRNLRRKTLVRCLRKLFSIIVATVGVAWFLDLFTIWQKKKKRLTKKSLTQTIGNLEEQYKEITKWSNTQIENLIYLDAQLNVIFKQLQEKCLLVT